MKKSIYDNITELSISDAFKALNDIDKSFDDALRKKYEKLDEGVSVSLNGVYNKEELDDALQEEDDTTLKVIDVNADTLDHIKNNKSYIGQMIAKCKVCQALRFLDAEDLKVSEEDPDVYNIEDECPNCHSEGEGFVIVGQVGKAETEEVPSQEENQDEVNVTNDQAVDSEENVGEVGSEEVGDDEIAFDNDVAPSEGEDLNLEQDKEEVDVTTDEGEEETESDEEVKFEEEPEKDFDETDAEDDTEDLDLPDLGDILDSDDVEEDKTEDEDDKKVKEDLKESFGIKADEFDTWEDLKDAITNLPDNHCLTIVDQSAPFGYSYMRIAKNGPDEYKLWNVDKDDVEAADLINHSTLRNTLHWARRAYDGSVSEGYETESSTSSLLECVTDLMNNIVDHDCIDNVCCLGDNCKDIIYKGSYDELPELVKGAHLKGFNTAGNNFIINVSKEGDQGLCIKDLLDKFTDSDCDNISLFDVDCGDEVYCGNKAGAIDKCGEFIVWSIDKPNAIEFITDCKADIPWKKEDDDYDEYSNLIHNVLQANGMNDAKIDNPKCVEHAIAESIRTGEDLEIIYDNYVQPISEALSDKFKEVTGYKDDLDLALEKKQTVTETAPRNDDVRESLRKAKELLKKDNAFAVIYGYNLGGKFYELPDMYSCRDNKELQIAHELVKNKYHSTGMIYTVYASKSPLEESNKVVVNEETDLKGKDSEMNKGADKLDEKLIEAGVEAIVVTDPQYATMIGVLVRDKDDLEKVKIVADKVFDELGWEAGEVKETEEEDSFGVTYDKITTKKVLGENYCRDRKELAKRLNELKSKGIEFKVSKSLVEGYRYKVDTFEDYNPDDYKADDLDAKADEYEKEQQAIETVDFDSDAFDKDINDYFDSEYEDTVVYESIRGVKDKDTGKIIIEGILTSEEGEKPVKFLLEPKVNEELGVDTYLVRNNISEEVFEFVK